MDGVTVEALQGCQHGTVVLRQIRIDADQVRVERCMMNFTTGCPNRSFLVSDNMGGTENKGLGQSRQCATTVVGSHDGHAE
jgi:hypothetical protein